MAAQHNRARIISVLLLGLTLAVGFMFGLAWDAHQADPVVPIIETVEGLAEPDEEEMDSEADTAPNRGPVIYELGLEPEQHAGVDEIIGHFRSNMRTLNEEAREEYNRKQMSLVMRTQDSIKAILNPQQIAQYDSLLVVRYARDRDGRDDDRRERRRNDRREDGEGN